MTIAHRSTSILANASRTTSVIPAPSGMAAGDVVLISINVGAGAGSAPTITSSDGLTQVSTVGYGSASDYYYVRNSVYRYVVPGSGALTSFTFTHSSALSDGSASAYTGVDTTTPIDVTPTTNTGAITSGDNNAHATSLTTVTDGCELVVVRGSWDGNAITPPSGWTERVDHVVTWYGDKAQATAGATGTIDVASGNTYIGGYTSPWAATLIALRPASTGGSPITASATGIASALTFGAVAVALSLTASPTGIASSEAFGSPTASIVTTASPTGIASGEAFGTPTVTTALTAAPTGIGSSEAFGTPVVGSALTASPTGIASGETFGTPALTATLTASPSGIASGAALGDPTVSTALTATPTGIATGEAFGSPTALTAGEASPTGIPSGEAFGTPVVSGALTVSPTGIGSGEAFGSPTVAAVLTAAPTSIPSAEAFGTPAASGDVTASPAGIASAEAFGAVTVHGGYKDITVTGSLGTRWTGALGATTRPTAALATRWKGTLT